MSVGELSIPFSVIAILKSVTHSFSFKCITKQSTTKIFPLIGPFPELVRYSGIQVRDFHVDLYILVDREVTVHPDVAPVSSPLPNHIDDTKPTPRLKSKSVQDDDAQWSLFTSPMSLDHSEVESN